MMDPAQNPRVACVDDKWLQCPATPDAPISRVLDYNNSSSWPASAPLLDDENLLEEILLRLPPQPSSLPRASLVCMRWRSILSDPKFLKRYRKHHQEAPLLGFFTTSTSRKHEFFPILNTKPDRIPIERFVVPKCNKLYVPQRFLGCRHGLAILVNASPEIVVWDPLIGQQHHVPFPQGLLDVTKKTFWFCHAAVLCADTEDGHVHGDCFSSPFKLVLICGGDTHAFACLYESASGLWRNIVSTVTTDVILRLRPSILIGNVLFWLLCGGGILEFDIERQSLNVSEKPLDAHGIDSFSFQLIRTNDSALGFAVLSKLRIQLWERKLNGDCAVEWVLQKIIQLEDLFPQEIRSDIKGAVMVGYDEDSNVIVLGTCIGDFMLQLESMLFRRISERKYWDRKTYYPYRNFYTAGRGDGWKWVDQKL